MTSLLIRQEVCLYDDIPPKCELIIIQHEEAGRIVAEQGFILKFTLLIG